MLRALHVLQLFTILPPVKLKKKKKRLVTSIQYHPAGCHTHMVVPQLLRDLHPKSSGVTCWLLTVCIVSRSGTVSSLQSGTPEISVFLPPPPQKNEHMLRLTAS
ncbi:hypothetical protein FKM82_024456 [Ascaphus truei]